MPSLDDTPKAPINPWWSSIRPHTPTKQNATDHHQPKHPDRVENEPTYHPNQQPALDPYESMGRSRSDYGQEGMNGTVTELAPLQDHDDINEAAGYDPVSEDNPASFDLLAPTEDDQKKEYSLEKRAETLFSREHLQVIFNDPSLLFKFTTFLTTQRPHSLPILVHYLDTLKAIRAIHYANAIAEGLDLVKGHEFTSHPAAATVNASLEQRANSAFDALARDDLPAYITSLYIQIVSLSVTKRITGSLAPRLRDASEGLAEVFCLTDPSRPDNPIVFSSEGVQAVLLEISSSLLIRLLEFNRTTQYGTTYSLGRNCRFLQGPNTNQDSVRRIRESIKEGRHHQEVFLN
jgi:hypothetical protein